MPDVTTSPSVPDVSDVLDTPADTPDLDVLPQS
jgi:hypothetical protein